MADIWDEQVGALSDQTNPSTINRLDMIRQIYRDIGLGDIFETIILEQMVRDPSQSSREILNLGVVQNSEAYKARFKANEARVANGGKALSPLEYVQLEKTYEQYMRQAGLPKGFYDSPDDFQDWIGKDVAASEVQGRVAMAADAYNTLQQNDPGQLQALSDMFGVGRDGVMAYFLDPDKAVSLLDKQQQLGAAKVAGAGNNFGVTTSKDQAMSLAAKGISEPEARERYRSVAADSESVSKLGSIYGDAISEGEQVTEAFGLDGADKIARRKKKLASQERAAFSGTSGIAQGSLSQKKQAI